MRVFGLETEYGLHAEGLDAKHAARELFAGVDVGSQSPSFLVNGGRLYLDVGDHPEYATAECASVEDVVAQDRAGDHLVADLAARATQRTGRVFTLFRDNSDGRGHSYGCHENYSVRRDRFERVAGPALVAFLVTRTAVVGAGGIRGGRFILSERAFEIATDFASASTHDRPLVNTRDQSLAGPDWRRLHVICGDTNVLPASTALKVGATALVLDALESRSFALSIDDPIGALRAISEGGPRVVLESSLGSVDAIALQRRFLDLAGADGGWRGRVTQLWLRALDALESDPQALVGQLDWPTKRALLAADARRVGVGGLDEYLRSYSVRARRLSMLFHQVGGRVVRSFDSDWLEGGALERALASPPADTRAWVRGKLIELGHRFAAPLSVDWDTVRVGGEVVRLPDPLDADMGSAQRLEQLLASRGGSF